MKEEHSRYEALLSGTSAEQLRALADAPAVAFGRGPDESVVLMNCALRRGKDRLVILSGIFLSKTEDCVLRASEICWSRKTLALRQPTLAEVQGIRQRFLHFWAIRLATL